MKKKILIIGGGGYVGTSLTEQLINNDYNVVVIDSFYYGNYLSPHKNLTIINSDIRDLSIFNKVHEINSIIYLACLSNDPSAEINKDLTYSINFTPFEKIVQLAIRNGVQQFIFASSSSVYGLQPSNIQITEKSTLDPQTLYSKLKLDCEKILSKYSSNSFITTIVRPATVCGVSKRQRFDVVVNLLCTHAYYQKKITVFNQNQYRPHIHIDDMVSFYIKLLLTDPESINGEVFNIGQENLKIGTLGKLIADCTLSNVNILYTQNNDNRSYRINSNKAQEILQFKYKKSVRDAIFDNLQLLKKNKISYSDIKFHNKLQILEHLKNKKIKLK